MVTSFIPLPQGGRSIRSLRCCRNTNSGVFLRRAMQCCICKPILTRQYIATRRDDRVNIITVGVGQGALAIVRHGREAIIVDSRIPACDDKTVAFVKELLAVSLKDHYVKGLVL